jgi:RHS repeat-associated protein
LGITNAYDAFLRRSILAFSTNSGSPALTNIYGYDAASRLSSVSDGTYSATYAYLANSPLVSTVTFKQNSTARMTTTKTYDFLNRLFSISSVPSASSAVNFSYLYNNANQRTERREPDASFWLYQYDSLGQVTSGKKYWSDWTPVAGQQFEYVFDDIGNRASTKSGGDSTGANLRSATYTANNLNQYTSRDVPGTVDIIGAANAAATATVNGQSTYRKVEYYQKALAIVNTSTNLWQSVTNQAVLTGTTNVTTGNIFLPKTQEVFAHDADGNLTNDGRWMFTWDAENRPLQMLSSNVVDGAKKKLDFVYDWRGRRRSKVVSTWSGSAFNPTSTNRFVYDDWNLVAEMDPTNNLIRSYLWGLDLSGTMQGAGGVGGLVAVNIVTNGIHFAAYDGNGNVSGLASATNGVISAQYEYGPFGELIRSSRTAAAANPCRFSTKFTDDESDFLYYGYRYYPPSTGRWISRDSINEKGGINLLAFVRNDPVRNFDVFGLKCRVALRCDGVVRSGLRLGTHCGLVIETDDGVKDFDGSGGDENIRGLAAGTAGDATGPWTDLPGSVCACIFANIDSWNQRHVPRDHTCANSNWNLKCLTKKCKIDINWGSQEKPIGYDCRECVYETLPRGDRDVKCCTSTREKRCPDE